MTDTLRCYEETRIVKTFTGPGEFVLSKIFPANILEVACQPSIASTLQIFEEEYPFSAPRLIGAGLIWSVPGKLLKGTLSISISNNAVVTVTVRQIAGQVCS